MASIAFVPQFLSEPAWRYYRALRLFIYDNKLFTYGSAAVIGAGIVVAAVVMAFQTARMIDESIVVTGVVRSITDATDRDGKVAIIQFYAPSGDRLETVQDGEGKTVGQEMKITLSGDHELRGKITAWIPAVVVGFAGYALSIVSLSWFLAERKARATQERLLRDGKRASGTVMWIRRRRLLKIGPLRFGPSSWFLSVDWKDPRTNDILQFDSDYLPWKPVDGVTGKSIPLLLDDGEDSVYWVDTRGVPFEGGEDD